MKRSSRKLTRRLGCFLKGVFSMALLIAFGFIVYLSTEGFPSWLLERIRTRIGAGQMYTEIEEMKLNWRRGIIIEDLHVYRDSVIGPPAFEIEKTVVVPDIKALLSGRLPVKKTIANGVVVRPALATGESSEQTPVYNTFGEFRMEMNDVELLGFHMKNASCLMYIDGPEIRLTEATCSPSQSNSAGKARAEILYRMDTDLMEGSFDTKFDLTLLKSVFEGMDMSNLAEVISFFKFKNKNPGTDFRFKRLCRSNGFFNLEGALWFEDCRFRGIDLERLTGRISAEFSATNEAVSVRKLLVERDEGTLRGWFDLNPRKSIVVFEGESTLYPPALARIVGVYPRELMERLSFTGPVNIKSNGKVNYRETKYNSIDARVESRALGIMEFITDECIFDLKSRGITNALKNISGKLYGGDFEGECSFILPSGSRSNTAYSGKGKINNARFEKIVSALTTNQEWKTDGEFTLEIELAGQIGEGTGETVTGKGKVKLKEGKIFTMPVFGEFTDIMTKAIPGLNFVLSQNEVQSEFLVERGKIKAKQVLIEGDVLSLYAKGDYYFDGNLDFKVQVRFLKERTFVGKILQTLMWPITTLFEFRLRGTLENPKWYPINFSDELLERLRLK